MATSAGSVVYQTGNVPAGQTEPSPSADLWSLKGNMYDAQKKNVLFLWQAMTLDAATLPAAISATPLAVTRSFSVPTSADKITARVRIRALPAEVLADLVTNAKLDPAVVANMPTFTLGKTVVEWTKANGFGCVP